jgi:RNase P subunit RPR2
VPSRFRHNSCTVLSVEPCRTRSTVSEVLAVQTLDKQHKHTAVTQHAIRQRSGIPYEIERRVCSSCHRVLNEKPLRRAAA